MATAPFICDVEASDQSLRTAVSSQQLRHRVCSYSLLQVLVGVLAVLVLALTGGVIWMKLFQNKVIQVWNNLRDCPEEFWRVRFTGTNTTFIAPRTQEYVIFGKVFAKTNDDNCQNSFRLHQIHDTQTYVITEQNISKMFREVNVMLWEGARLSVRFNCKSEINETSSELHIYPRHY